MTSRSGVFCFARPAAAKCFRSESMSSAAPGLSTTTAATTSPCRGSGAASAAPSATAGWLLSTSSTWPDDIVDPVGDGQPAGRIDMPEIAGAKPAVGGERLGVQCGIAVTDELLRPPDDDLAVLPRRHLCPVGCDDAQRRAGQWFAVRAQPRPLGLARVFAGHG